MHNDKALSTRWFLGWVEMGVGALLGWVLADLGWGATNPSGVWAFGGPRTFPIDYWLMKACWTVSGGVLGLAFARWRDVPIGGSEDVPAG